MMVLPRRIHMQSIKERTKGITPVGQVVQTVQVPTPLRAIQIVIVLLKMDQIIGFEKEQPISPVEEILRSPVVPTNNIPNENMIDENDTLNLDLTMENHQLLMVSI
ncbi:hypothetical protein Tco_1332857, partial [Tanacetum coccineum]